MNESYKDITDKLGKPYWWDEHAVPRYCEFHPDKCANIYADEAVLLLIGCQNCRYQFPVSMTTSKFVYRDGEVINRLFSNHLDTLYFGDPPNYEECCGAGATMTSDTLKVIEFWTRDNNAHWNNRPDLITQANQFYPS